MALQNAPSYAVFFSVHTDKLTPCSSTSTLTSTCTGPGGTVGVLVGSVLGCPAAVVGTALGQPGSEVGIRLGVNVGAMLRMGVGTKVALVGSCDG